MSEKLALFGGPKKIVKPFIRYNSIGKEEIKAATDVIKTGKLSPYVGAWEKEPGIGGFYGGKKVQEFERIIEDSMNVKHAITVNSATSALISAIGAAGINPGDEVIVSPWTMCATATSILWWNAIPVFTDIELDTFNLDPVSIEANLTPLTKAIVVPDIFGHPAELNTIMKIAEKNNLVVIEDCAQSPTAIYEGRFAGTIADIGVLSLNYHKHIHTGEGGICLTNDSILAEKIQLIRNHAEAVVGDKGVTDLSNMIGFNFRLGEIESAIGIEQFKKLDHLVSERVKRANKLTEGLNELEGLRTPIVKKDCTHVYYVYPLIINNEVVNCTRDRIHEALVAEGVPVSNEYANLHLLPMYQNKIAYGNNGFPWNSDVYKGNVSYEKGICPTAEDLNDKMYLGIGLCSYKFSDEEINLVIKAFHKVWDNLDKL